MSGGEDGRWLLRGWGRRRGVEAWRGVAMRSDEGK